jgi:hypothetical protein
VGLDSRGRILIGGWTEPTVSTQGKTAEGFLLPNPAPATIYRLLPGGQPDQTFGVGGEAQAAIPRPAPETVPLEGTRGETIAGQSRTPTISITGLAVDSEDRPLLLGSSPGQAIYCTYDATAGYRELSFAARLTASGSILVLGVGRDVEGGESREILRRYLSNGSTDKSFGEDGTTTTKFDAGLYNPPPAILGVGIDGKDRATITARLRCKAPYSAACRPVLVRYLGN